MPGCPERPGVRRGLYRVPRDLHGLPIDPDIESDAAGGQASQARWPALPVRVLVAVFGGGVAGGLARYGIEYAVASPADRFPWETFVVNIAGAFGLALLLVLALELAPSLRQLRPAVATGFFGAFTTFSSLVTGVDHFIGHGQFGLAFGYGAGSVVGGLAAASLGFVIGRAVVANRRTAGAAGRLPGELAGSTRD